MTTPEYERNLAKRRSSARAHRGTRRRFSRPSSRLASDGPRSMTSNLLPRIPHPPDAPVMMHLHGFGLSGRYLLPTAEALADEFHTLVPDLPGFGRSGNAIEPLTVEELAHAAAAFLDTQGIEKVTLGRKLDGLSGDLRVWVRVSGSVRAGDSGVACWRHKQSAATPGGTAAQPRRYPGTGSAATRGSAGLSAVRPSEHLSDVPVRSRDIQCWTGCWP